MKRIPWTFVFPFDNGGETSVTGYTPLPEKSVDYMTPADQEAIVQQVIAAMGTPVFGRVDTAKKIILTANGLPDGTYELWFEDEDGKQVELCELTKGAASEQIINWIPLSTDTDGTTIYNGQGWKTGLRINSSGAIKEQAGYELTGFIPFVKGDVLRGSAGIIGTTVSGSVANTGYNVISLYDSSRAFIANVELKAASTAAGLTINADESFVFDSSLNDAVTTNVAYIRVTTVNITSSSILTVNQEIA